MSDLEQMREEVIRKIEAAFPKTPRKKLKKIADARQWSKDAADEVEALLSRQWWIDVSTQTIRQVSRDVDYLRVITSEAIEYYMPAFLVAILDNLGDNETDNIVLFLSWTWRFLMKKYRKTQIEAVVDVLKIVVEQRKLAQRDEFINRVSRKYQRETFERLEKTIKEWSTALENKNS